MSRLEIYSPEGLRIDGRCWNELRNFECSINTHPNSADGSSYVRQGNTQVMCLVNGPQEPANRNQMLLDRASLNVSINVASFSTADRKKRSKGDRRIQELNTILERTFEEVIVVSNYPRTCISVSIHVIAQDGGLFAACANAMTMALVDSGIAMYDYVVSSSSGVFDVTPLLDLNHLEELDVPYLTVGIVGSSDKISLLLLENRMPLDRMEGVLAIGISGCHRIREIMDAEVRRQGAQRLSKMINN